MSGGELRLESRSRARSLGDDADDVASLDPDRLVVCDWGLELDKATRRVNISRHDPWFARAVEAVAAADLQADRAIVYDTILQVFALAHIDHLCRKLLPHRTFDRLVLQSASGEVAESLSLREWASARGRESIRRLRCQCIAGNGARLLAASDRRLARLLERFGEAIDERR